MWVVEWVEGSFKKAPRNGISESTSVRLGPSEGLEKSLCTQSRLGLRGRAFLIPGTSRVDSLAYERMRRRA